MAEAAVVVTRARRFLRRESRLVRVLIHRPSSRRALLTRAVVTTARRPGRRVILAAIPVLVVATSGGFVLTAQPAAGLDQPSRSPRIVVEGVAQLGLVGATPISAFATPSGVIDQAPPAATTPPRDARALLRFYMVADGDTLWTIAASFKLSYETLVWANGLDDPAAVQVGQTLVIPPADGLLYTVAPQDTLESIAARFGISAKAIYDASQLESHNLFVGELLMLPEAQGAPIPTPTPKPTPPPTKRPVVPVAPQPPAPDAGNAGATWGLTRTYNAFAYGYCTWGAAEIFHSVTGAYPGWIGDAWAWGANAAAAGWTVTSTPHVNSIIVFPPWDQGAGGLGHVGWVTGVNSSAGTVTVHEMNGLAGWNRWDDRIVRMDGTLRYILIP